MNCAKTWLILAAGVAARLSDCVRSTPVKGPFAIIECFANKRFGGSRSAPIHDPPIVTIRLSRSFSSRPRKVSLANRNKTNAVTARIVSFKIVILLRPHYLGRGWHLSCESRGNVVRAFDMTVVSWITNADYFKLSRRRARRATLYLPSRSTPRTPAFLSRPKDIPASVSQNKKGALDVSIVIRLIILVLCGYAGSVVAGTQFSDMPTDSFEPKLPHHRPDSASTGY